MASVLHRSARTVTFSGDKPMIDNTLPIDAVMSVGAHAIRDDAAEGSCLLATSDDGAVVRTLTCDATTKTGAVALDFTGGG